MSKSNYIWVVEGCFDDAKWVPTVDVGFTRDEVRKKLYEWENNCPYDRFRVRKYVAQEAK